ncbi:MAG TPA: protein translocase subunit SecD, partial [Phycisphaerae bacterium]|nr:protein translocase subunit SecD [Phycisphaerae bacterium]
MQERDLWWKIVIVGVLVALAYASVMPFKEKIKMGIDLAGGYSLLYELDDEGMEGGDRINLSQRVIEVLRRRVDPKGVYNLVWRPVGSNRIEIQMPQPGETVQAARRKYEELQSKLQETLVRRSAVVAAVARMDNRAEEMQDLAKGVPVRLALLEAAARAYDEMKAVEPLAGDTDKTKEALLAALRLPAEQRAAALQPLIDELPDRKNPIDKLVKAYDEYQAVQTTQPSTEPTTQPATQPTEDEKTAKRLAYEAALQRVLDVSLDRSVSLESAFDKAVGAVVATNLDINQLLSVLEMKPKDQKRKETIETLKAENPGLADLIDDLVKQNDELRDTRKRGEGRLEDPADLQRLLRGAGVLEFRIIPTTASDPTFDPYRDSIKKRGPRPMPGEESYQWFEIEDPADFLNLKGKDDLRRLEEDFDTAKMGFGVVVERFGDKYYVLSHIGEGYAMTHSLRPGEHDWSLVSASMDRDEAGAPAIGFRLDTAAGAKFGPLTRQHRGQQLAIFLDDQAVSHARINSPITTSGIIQGRFTPQEVQEMVKKLNAGSLPQKLKDPPISVRAIGPSLGEANQRVGLQASVIGGIAVLVFLTVYYRYAGAIACIALAINVLFTFAVMAILGATLTLPGIAGLVLALGMSVDANVLVNERIREELARGTAFRMAVKLGYERAFSAILDSNVTMVLTSAILYLIGSEQIKGFGLTLGVGVFISTFTAYFITRMFFEMMAMISVPKEVFRRPLLTGVTITLIGLIFYGLGYAMNDAATRADSRWVVFGNSLITVGPAVLLLLLLMWLARSIHANRKTLPMAGLIGVPKIDWIGHRKLFYSISAVLVGGSIFLFFWVPDKDLYDIEFLGGVNAQVDLKESSPIFKLDSSAKRQDEIQKRLEKSGETLVKYGEAMERADVSGASGTYTLATPGVPATRLVPIVKDVLEGKLSATNALSFSDPASEVITIHTREEAELDPVKLKADLALRFERAGENIGSAQVQAIAGIEAGDKQEGQAFTVTTREASKDVVIDAIVENLKDDLDIQSALTFKLGVNESGGGTTYFPIRENDPK